MVIPAPTRNALTYADTLPNAVIRSPEFAGREITLKPIQTYMATYALLVSDFDDSTVSISNYVWGITNPLTLPKLKMPPTLRYAQVVKITLRKITTASKDSYLGIFLTDTGNSVGVVPPLSTDPIVIVGDKTYLVGESQFEALGKSLRVSYATNPNRLWEAVRNTQLYFCKELNVATLFGGK